MQIFGIELLGSQLLLSVFIVFILFKTWLSYKVKQISSLFYVLWLLFWLSGLFIIFYPGFLSKMAAMLGIGRGVDFALYISIICLFYLVYRVNLKIEKLNRDITKIVRQTSLNR